MSDATTEHDSQLQLGIILHKKPEQVEVRRVAVWTTRDGREIPITQMSDGHLMNSIRLLRRKATAKARGAADRIRRNTPQRRLDQEAQDYLRVISLQGVHPSQVYPIYEALVNEAQRRGFSEDKLAILGFDFDVTF